MSENNLVDISLSADGITISPSQNHSLRLIKFTCGCVDSIDFGECGKHNNSEIWQFRPNNSSIKNYVVGVYGKDFADIRAALFNCLRDNLGFLSFIGKNPISKIYNYTKPLANNIPWGLFEEIIQNYGMSFAEKISNQLVTPIEKIPSQFILPNEDLTEKKLNSFVDEEDIMPFVGDPATTMVTIRRR